MKNRIFIIILAAFLPAGLSLLAGCSSDGGSPAADTGTGTGSSRTFSGTLTGDLTNIAAINAVNAGAGADASVVLALVAPRALRINAATSPADYDLEMTEGESYNIVLVDASGATVAVMEWPTSAAGGLTTSVINVSGGAAVDLGFTEIPPGTDSSVTTLVSSSNNPLASTDADGDGESDFDDTDDDNDGILDVDDDDDDGDGVDDRDEESDDDGDGIPDIEDEDSDDVDDDNDGLENNTDTDDDNDGIPDVDDDDDDGDGIPDVDDPDSDDDNDHDGIDDDVDDDDDNDGIPDDEDDDDDGIPDEEDEDHHDH